MGFLFGDSITIINSNVRKEQIKLPFTNTTHLLQRNLGDIIYKTGGAVYEIYNRVYTTEQNQTRFIPKNYEAHEETSEINVGLHDVCFGCKKNRKDGSYILVSGQERFETLKKHTKNIYAPCIVDKSVSPGMISWFYRLRLWNKQPIDDFPLMPTSWLIVRSFLKQEPRFQNLSRPEQIRVLRIAACYKKTVIYTMKKTVDEILRSNQ